MNEWISIKERLPNKLQKVLFHWVLCDSFGNPCVKNVSMGYLCEGGWDIYVPYHSFALRADVCPVTHWMELPEFPEDDGFPFQSANIIEMPEKPTLEHTKDFADKFCRENDELLKRLANR